MCIESAAVKVLCLMHVGNRIPPCVVQVAQRADETLAVLVDGKAVSSRPPGEIEACMNDFLAIGQKLRDDETAAQDEKAAGK